MVIVGRDHRTARWIELEVRDERIEGVRAGEGPAELDENDEWLAPAFWDIQLNGRWGHSFSSPDTTVEQVAKIVKTQAALGTARLCPTLISGPAKEMLHGARTIAAACRTDTAVARMVLGIHLEGPFLSDREGYRGAHPASALRDPDWGLFQDLQDASGHRVILLTLAPERPGALEFIEQATASGVVIALGHTAADGPTIEAAVAAGARLSTHLGNGIAAQLPRHPNPIWHQAANDRLYASMIADGHHLHRDTLRVLARAKGVGRLVLVSDASPLAGLPPGRYGDWAVDPSGKIMVAETPYLAGSNQPLETGIRNLLAAEEWPLDLVIDTVIRNPAILLGRPVPELCPGEPANVVVFRRSSPRDFVLDRTCVDGKWHRSGS
jgi:N-acetylglucosamine-6-phosphate deacetylase